MPTAITEAQIDRLIDAMDASDKRFFGLRLLFYGAIPPIGAELPNSWHPADWVQDTTEGERTEAIELNGACAYPISHADADSIRYALRVAKANGYELGKYGFMALLLIGSDEVNDGDTIDGENFGLPEQGAMCYPHAVVLDVVPNHPTSASVARSATVRDSRK